MWSYPFTLPRDVDAEILQRRGQRLAFSDQFVLRAFEFSFHGFGGVALGFAFRFRHQRIGLDDSRFQGGDLFVGRVQRNLPIVMTEKGTN